MLATSQPAPDVSAIRVEITPTIERELQRRGMFPELRLERAAQVINGATGVYFVSRARAAEILADAATMRTRVAELKKGVPAAYTALGRKLAEALRTSLRQGLWKLPEKDEMLIRLKESPARFEVGDSCLYFRDESEEYGTSVTIIRGFGVYTVNDDNGHFIDDQGRRVEPMYGYVVQERNGERYFCRPYQLTGDDCKPSHLRLVANRYGASPSHEAYR